MKSRIIKYFAFLQRVIRWTVFFIVATVDKAPAIA